MFMCCVDMVLVCGCCVLSQGELNRIMGAHAMNNHSSRSHCIFTLHIQVLPL